jgi:hypothetical protein
MKRPLLILDLNNMLVARAPYEMRKQGGMFARSIKRPGADAFVDFCLEHFAVGVWSCGQLKNMELWLFGGRAERLAFAWHQEHATNKYPRTSAVDAKKPLFVKELNGIFRQYPCWGPHNTLLLDDHLEKFEDNPPHTCVLVPAFEWSRAEADRQLGQQSSAAAAAAAAAVAPATAAAADGTLLPGGKLATALREVATAYAGGVATNKFLESHPSPFFPTKLPRSSAQAAADGGAGSGGAGGDGAAAAAPSWQAEAYTHDLAHRHGIKKRLVTRYYSAPGAQAYHARAAREAVMDPERYLKSHADTPGARALSFRRGDLLRACGAELGPAAAAAAAAAATGGARRQLAHDGHLAAEKTDGVRYWLFATGGDTYLIDRKWGVKTLREGARFFAALSPRGNDTLLDGELVFDVRGGADANGAPLFVVFDALFADGDDVGSDPELTVRLARAKALVTGAYEALAAAAAAQPPPQAAHLPLGIVVKKMVPLGDLRAVAARIERAVQGGAGGAAGGHAQRRCRYELSADSPAADDRRLYPAGGMTWVTGNDGIVFTPRRRPAQATYTVWKWKPMHENTIDFKVSSVALRDAPPGGGPPLFLSDAGNEVPNRFGVERLLVDPPGAGDAGSTAVDAAIAKALGNSAPTAVRGLGRAHLLEAAQRERRGYLIVECSYDATRSGWVAQRLRPDKAKPNGLGAAWRVMEVLAEGLHEEELLASAEAVWAATAQRRAEALPAAQPGLVGGGAAGGGGASAASALAMVMGGGGGGGAAAPAAPPLAGGRDLSVVGSHYDARQQQRNEIRQGQPGAALDGRIHCLRKLNNWAKAVMVGEFCAAGRVPRARADPTALMRPAPCPPVLRQRGRGRGGRRGGGGRKPSATVLEIACGRGGDLKKWTTHFRVEHYVGTDLSHEQLEEGRRRTADMYRNAKPESSVFVQHDMCAPSLAAAIAAPPNSFDFVAVQFAMHYACEDADGGRLRSLLANVRAQVKESGRSCAICTFPDRWACVGVRAAAAAATPALAGWLARSLTDSLTDYSVSPARVCSVPFACLRQRRDSAPPRRRARARSERDVHRQQRLPPRLRRPAARGRGRCARRAAGRATHRAAAGGPDAGQRGRGVPLRNALPLLAWRRTG